MDDEQLLDDVVSSIVEKILMNIGMTTYVKVKEIMEAHNLKFSDCYRNPDVLNFALKELFGNAYLIVVEKIKSELGGLVDDDRRLSMFVQKLSK
ncbi:MAG: hypothetical protein KGH88_05320 [Thaumarchaeota archaeon]|nr:hypothetical protein [Nitrososphaerota archaeon]